MVMDMDMVIATIIIPLNRNKMFLFDQNTTLEKSGLLQRMSDFHCHLLPGVDDGIQKIEDTLAILDYYESIGIREVWFTPHIMEDVPNTTQKLTERFEWVKSQYTGHIPLHLAAEYMLDNNFAERLKNKDLLPLGNDKDHLLVETTTFNAPSNLEKLFAAIKSAGYFPVFAHPERYTYLDKKDYIKWKNFGVKLQLNLLSLQGGYGKAEKEKAEWMLSNDMYDYYGTDTHTTRHIANNPLPLSEFKIKKKLVPHLAQLIEVAY